MLKTTGLSVASTFRVDNNKVVGDGGSAGAKSGGSVGGLDASKKSRMENRLIRTEYPEDEKGIHLSCKPQRAGLIAKKTPTKVSIKYADFADVFFPNMASKLPKHTEINKYAIKLVDTNKFIRPSKSLTGIPILFDRKSDGSL